MPAPASRAEALIRLAKVVDELQTAHRQLAYMQQQHHEQHVSAWWQVQDAKDRIEYRSKAADRHTINIAGQVTELRGEVNGLTVERDYLTFAIEHEAFGVA